MKLKFKHELNKYDYFIVILIVSNIVGLYGMPLTIPRIIDIILFPVVLKSLKNYRTYPSYVLFFSMIWLSYCALSTIWSIDKIEAIKCTGYNCLSIIGFLSLILFSKKATNSRLAIVLGWCLLFSISAPIAINELLTDVHLSNCSHLEGAAVVIDGVPTSRHLASVTFGNLNEYNLVVVYCMPFLFLLLSYREIASTIKGILFLSMVYVVIMNASRGALLCLLIMTSITLFFGKKKKFISNKSVFICSISLILLFVYFFDVIFAQIASRVVEDGLTTDENRLDLIRNGLKVWEDYVYMGAGVGNLGNALTLVAPTDIPAIHNLFIEILTEYGWFVFLCFTFLLYWIFRKLIKSESWRIQFLGYMAVMSFIPMSIINSGYISSTNLWTYLSSLIVMTLTKESNDESIGLLNNQL